MKIEFQNGSAELKMIEKELCLRYDNAMNCI